MRAQRCIVNYLDNTTIVYDYGHVQTKLKHRLYIYKYIENIFTIIEYRRSLFTIFSKPIPAHVNIQVQYYTQQNITRGIPTTYINDKCINI